MMESKHILGYCNACETEMVYCGTCGNNCCNGSYGPLPGTDMSCPDCPDAYDMQSLYWTDPLAVKFKSTLKNSELKGKI